MNKFLNFIAFLSFIGIGAGAFATPLPPPPALSASAYLLMDYANGHILLQKDENKRVEPASLTKMMTIYVVDEALKDGKIKLSDPVHISEYAWRAPGSRMFVEVNTDVTIDALRRGVIIQSGNDASIALAEHVAGSEAAFVEWMNNTAKSLNMHHTHFANASGLPDPDHYSTAADMAKLAAAMIRDFPETYSIYAEKEFTYKEIRQENRNRLLWRNALVDGVKTGHTDSAGYCLVASGKKEHTRFIAVVMGAPNERARIEDSNALLNYGFRFFKTQKLYTALTPVQQRRIWLGANKTIDLGLEKDLYVTIPVGQIDKLKAELNVDSLIKAPATQGRVLGKLSIQLDNQVLLERPIVALNEVKSAGLWGRMVDTLRLTVAGLREKAGV
jgi:D-alanyl-D-alanine carboxypeptidase (penicillin-binding protein 5/6)